MPDDKRRHFFVSVNQADRDWATWIAWVLEENDYSVFFQDWDFRGSFIEQMHQASQRAERTLVVLSDHYLHSEYARSEAWHRLTIDPVGREDSPTMPNSPSPSPREREALTMITFTKMTKPKPAKQPSPTTSSPTLKNRTKCEILTTQE